VNPPAQAPVRLAIVLSHPTQYYSPWFRWLRSHTQIPFRVFYLWDFGVTRQRDPGFETTFSWDVDLVSGYDHEFVPNLSHNPGAESFFGFNNPRLTNRLAQWRPSAVLLFGYKWASHMRVIAWAWRNRTPLIFRGDSHLIGRGSPGPLVRLALSAVYSRFASILYVGEANRAYFKEFGVPDSRLFFSPHSVDADLFNPETASHRDSTQALRARLGIAAATRVVLFAGKLTEAKQPAELLEAFISLGRPETALVFVGDGPEKAALEGRARAAAGGRVHFLPFANQSEMPARYLLADLFALPSRGVYETWGLAVNEAMQMGIPCLVSDRVGCQRDLVVPGETGWVFDPGDPKALGATLGRALDDLSAAPRAAQLRGAVRQKIAGYGYPRTTAGLLEALAAMRLVAPNP
jgi:glycosyltransferase involved in cell wall biosynthesis